MLQVVDTHDQAYKYLWNSPSIAHFDFHDDQRELVVDPLSERIAWRRPPTQPDEGNFLSFVLMQSNKLKDFAWIYPSGQLFADEPGKWSRMYIFPNDSQFYYLTKLWMALTGRKIKYRLIEDTSNWPSIFTSYHTISLDLDFIAHRFFSKEQSIFRLGQTLGMIRGIHPKRIIVAKSLHYCNNHALMILNKLILQLQKI